MSKTTRFIPLFMAILMALIVITPASAEVTGNVITYRCLDSLEYEVTYTFYRECSDTSLIDPSSDAKVTCIKSGKSVGLSLSFVSSHKLLVGCDTTGDQCDSTNKAYSGGGIECLIYKDTVDFKQSVYGPLLTSGCKELYFEFSRGYRSSDITTGAANANFYNYAMLDLSLGWNNSTPHFTYDPVMRLTANQPWYQSYHAIDTVDGDSLSFKLEQPLSAFGKRISTQKPPIDVYYPGSLGYPYVNPGANPPIGLYFDQYTGEWIMTPIKSGQVANIVVEVKEWRKDSSGKYQNIGTIQQDIKYTVQQYIANNPPMIKGQFSSAVCEGEELCYTITADDKVRKPPPPAPAPDPDTVRLSWDGAISDASFKILNDSALRQSARFCWTPPVGSARSYPYFFTVQAIDNNCPKNAVSSRAFQIKVNSRAKASVSIKDLDCGRYLLSSSPDSTNTPVPRYQWHITPVGGKNPGPRWYSFASTGTIVSVIQNDTLTFRQNGTYILHHTIDNKFGCTSVYMDTIEVKGIPEVMLSHTLDTFICSLDTLRLKPTLINRGGGMSYEWSSGDTTSTLDLTMPPGRLDTTIVVTVRRKDGCTAWDSVVVFQRANPVVSITQSDIQVCTYDSVNLIPTAELAVWDDPRTTYPDTIIQGDTLTFSWWFSGARISADTSLSGILAKGLYKVQAIDSLGCSGWDSIMVHVNDTVKAKLSADQTVCWNDYIQLGAQGLDTVGSGKSGTYRWWSIDQHTRVSLGSKDSLNYYIRSSTTYELEVYITEDTVTCVDSDTMQVTVNPLPKVTMPADMVICHNAGAINFRLMEDPNATGGTWYCPANPKLVKNGYLFLTDSAGDATGSTKKWIVYYDFTDSKTTCTTTDSFMITVNPVPDVEVRDGYFCQKTEVVNLKDKIIVHPRGGALNLGRQTWRCVDCSTYNPNAIIEDKGTGGAGAPQDFVLYVDPTRMPLGSKKTDSITIQLEFRSIRGCYNYDTAKIVVSKGVDYGNANFSNVCWGSDTVSLQELSNSQGKDGYWTAINMAGYNNSDELNNALIGDDLSVQKVPRPIAQGSATYRMRYSSSYPACVSYDDADLTILNVPDVAIDRSVLRKYSNKEPYLFCELDTTVGLRASPANGTWTSSDSLTVSGSTFDPRKATFFNTPFELTYNVAGTNGCIGYDTVLVSVQQKQDVEVMNDTAFTWYGAPMSLNVRTAYSNSTGVTWKPLTGGNVANPNATQTTYTFFADRDTITRHLLYVYTDQNSSSVCPFAEATMQIFVHPDPCIEFEVDYDLSNGEMTLKPLNLNMATYYWEVGDSSSYKVQPTIDVSRMKDSIIWVKLTTHNQLGDDCQSSTRINLKTGSVKDIRTRIQVYPNPVGDYFIVKSNLSQFRKLKIYDASGRTVKNMKLTSNRVDCADLAPGVYNLEIQDDLGVYLGRFVKQ